MLPSFFPLGIGSSELRRDEDARELAGRGWLSSTVDSDPDGCTDAWRLVGKLVVVPWVESRGLLTVCWE